PMRRRHPRLLAAAALALGVALSGCESFDLADKIADLDIMGTSKKPLPGERKQVFPQGVPGVAQGVPPELVKGYQPPPETPTPPVADENDKPKVATKPKKKKVAAPKPAAPRQAAPQQQAAPEPAPQQ